VHERETTQQDDDLAPPPTLSLGVLVARQAITDRLHDYCRAMDQMDHELGYSVWHPDGQAHYDGIFEGTGREFVDWVLASHARMDGTFHQVTNVRVDVAGERATSEAYHLACNRVGPNDLVMRGWYRDSWSCRDGEWRIDERRQSLAMMQVIPVVELPRR
jgi:hypothetical protein